ncbi:MAG: ribonuclease HII [Desulfobacteraceae bacterium]|nr:MAG: ribonuclease HII [Desulfobacteraceae bacterium]
MAADVWAYEKKLRAKGYARIAGIDEAGRGPLAGPVVSAAVVLPPTFDPSGIDDSKKLTALQRERMYARIYAEAETIGIGIVDAFEIDRINILRAALLSMAMAAANLKPCPAYLLIDGTFKIPADLPQQAIPKGDALCVSISAASIVAKVTRDRLMQRYHEDYPDFGFDCHKGYATQGHLEAIACHGPCAIHRRSFKGICEHFTCTLDETDGITVDE